MNQIPDYLMAVFIAEIIGFIIIAFVVSFFLKRMNNEIFTLYKTVKYYEQRRIEERMEDSIAVNKKVDHLSGVAVKAVDKLDNINNGVNQVLSSTDHHYRQLSETVKEIKPKRDHHGKFVKGHGNNSKKPHQ